MKGLIVLSALLIFIHIPVADDMTGIPNGCPKVNLLSEALGKLERRPWKDLSADHVISVWPNQFDELKCSSEVPCRLLVSKNRVIAGHCECCEAFYFSVEQNPGRSAEHLKNVIVHYTSHEKLELVSAAKVLAKSFELPLDKVAVIGDSSAQRFEWKRRVGEIQEDSVAEIKFTPVGSNWELYLAVSVD